MSLRARAAAYSALLLALNFYIAGQLLFVEFTANMQTNAGSFLAITRFIVAHFPHLGWFPWWFNGLPFENSYTPMLHLMDAAFVWTTGASPARAYNFVTGSFYIAGPALLFLFAWRLTGFLETSFFAALLYSLYSPAALFPYFRNDVGLWNPWRLRVLVFWGEGPHIVMLAVLPFTLLAAHRAMTTRRYAWCAVAALLMAWTVLVNAFGATDLAIAGACLILALPAKEMGRAASVFAAAGLAAYLVACPFLPPSLLQTIAHASPHVGGEFSNSTMLKARLLILPGFAALWWATRSLKPYLFRFSLLFGFAMFQIVGLAAMLGVAALPQPHRYSLELEWAAALLAALALRSFLLRLPAQAKVLALILALAAASRQTIHSRRYARLLTSPIDVTQTMDYKAAKWLGANLGDLRAFVSGETGTWLNAFVDTPQMNSGHQPFDPNFDVDAEAAFTIYTGMNAGSRDAEIALLWLKAFGCHAVHVARSRLYLDVFWNPHKFDGVLPLLWRQGGHSIYGVPERVRSLAHVVPENALVRRRPVNGLDVAEIARYVAALDDPSLPADEMKWSRPGRGHIDTTLHSGQVISVQSAYDPGWVAFANGKPAKVAKDGLGLSVILADCQGPCSVDFAFEGGRERIICRLLSAATFFGGLIALFAVFKKARHPVLQP
ncbi:MAG TPA: hypothetical protein VKV74_08685 [Bryobacteraceae bacterium]|nr:hypothetical protein [Bryobacteraceae bacterium]